MGERKCVCEREGTDSCAGEKQFSSQGVQFLPQIRRVSSLLSLEISLVEAIGSSKAANNAHKKSFEDAAVFPQSSISERKNIQ